MSDKKEPQSYGSQSDWVTGKTGQKPNPERTGGFDEARESETSAPHQGGDTSPVQASEHAMPSGAPDSGHNVTAAEGGAKRGGYFKERDYEGKK